MARKWPYNRTQPNDVRTRWSDDEFKGLETLQKELGTPDITATLKSAVLLSLLHLSAAKAAETKKRKAG